MAEKNPHQTVGVLSYIESGVGWTKKKINKNVSKSTEPTTPHRCINIYNYT